MAQEGRTQLKTYFETGDIPTQSQFASLIDSNINITDDAVSQAQAEAGTSSDLKAWSPLRVNQAIVATASKKKTFQTLTSATNITMNTNNGINAKFTIAHNVTLTLINLANGDEGMIVVVQDSTGSRTLSISSEVIIVHAASNPLTNINPAADSTSLIQWWYDGTNLYTKYNFLNSEAP